MPAKGTSAKKFIEEAARAGQVCFLKMNISDFLDLQVDEEDPFAESRRQKIADRQNDYQRRGNKRRLSPARADMFGKLLMIFYNSLFFS
jgi:hypothetical protein